MTNPYCTVGNGREGTLKYHRRKDNGVFLLWRNPVFSLRNQPSRHCLKFYVDGLYCLVDWSPPMHFSPISMGLCFSYLEFKCYFFPNLLLTLSRTFITWPQLVILPPEWVFLSHTVLIFIQHWSVTLTTW